MMVSPDLLERIRKARRRAFWFEILFLVALLIVAFVFAWSFRTYYPQLYENGGVLGQLIDAFIIWLILVVGAYVVSMATLMELEMLKAIVEHLHGIDVEELTRRAYEK